MRSATPYMGGYYDIPPYMTLDTRQKKGGKMARSNLYTFLIYPKDSAPDNYMDIIRSWHVPVLISPVHAPSSDAYGEEEGVQKKRHLHVMIYFGSGANKSLEQVKVYSDKLHGTRPFIVNSRDGMIRYFIHLDDPDKQQYDIDEDGKEGHKWSKSDLISLSGFETGNAFESFSNEQQMYVFLENTIFDHHIYNFSDFIRFLRDVNCTSELDFVRHHTMYFKSILDGEYQKLDKKSKKG